MGLQNFANTKRWTKNHEIIKASFLKLYSKLKKLPTQQEIADDCKVSRITVNKHLKDLSLNDISPLFKLKADRVINGIAKKAETGDAPSAKLFFQIVFGWQEKSKIEESGETTVKNIDMNLFTDYGLERLKRGDNLEDVLMDPKSIKRQNDSNTNSNIS